MERWKANGVPTNPVGWLVTTARRKALDRLRRERTGAQKLALLAATECRPGDEPGAEPDDDRLALVFACCHPALPGINKWHSRCAPFVG